MGIGSHAPGAFGGQLGEFLDQPPALVEQLLGPVALHPVLEDRDVLRLGGHVRDRYLMRPPCALHLKPIHHLGARPPFGTDQHDHGPPGSLDHRLRPRSVLYGPYLLKNGVQGRGHQLVHGRGIRPFHDVGPVAVARQQLFQLLAADAGKHGGVGDLVAVEVQDGQDRSIPSGIQELVRVPRGCQGSGFRLAVADHTARDQVGVIEDGPIGVGQRVAQLATFVDGAWSLGSDVAGDATGKGELPEKPPQTLLASGDRRVELAISAFQIRVRHQTRSAVARPGDVDHIEVSLLDSPVEMDVDEVEAGGGAPMAEQPGLDMLQFERLSKQGIREQVDLSHRQVVGRTPVRVQLVDFGRGQLVPAGRGRGAHAGPPPLACVPQVCQVSSTMPITRRPGTPERLRDPHRPRNHVHP